MPRFDIEHRTINAFAIDDIILFKAFFDDDELYSQLEKCYNSDNYRYEVPEGDAEQVEQLLEEFYYELTYQDRFDPFITVAEKGIDTTNILRNAVHHQTRKQHHIFLMKDAASVEQAIEQGSKCPENTLIKTDDIKWQIDGS